MCIIRYKAYHNDFFDTLMFIQGTASLNEIVPFCVKIILIQKGYAANIMLGTALCGSEQVETVISSSS